MYVKELFDKCSKEKIWKHMLDDFFQNEVYERKNYFRQAVFDAIEIISTINEQRDDNTIILVYEYLDDLSISDYTRYIGTSMCNLQELSSSFHKDPVVESGVSTEEWNTSDFSYYFSNTKPFITTYCYILSEWDKTLGCRLCDSNLNEYGHERCAAAILYEMTYCGFTPWQVKERASDIYSGSCGLQRQEGHHYKDASLNKLNDVYDVHNMKISFKNWCIIYPFLKEIFLECMEV